MGYQSRKRQYKSRRERLERDVRNIRVTVLFVLIALGVLLFKTRYSWWTWLQTYFY